MNKDTGKAKDKITREEMIESFNGIVSALKEHTDNIEFLNNHFFIDIVTNEELYPCWLMTGECLKIIISGLKDTIKDIENGDYLSNKEVPA
jgi:hypothetical protein